MLVGEYRQRLVKGDCILVYTVSISVLQSTTSSLLVFKFGGLLSYEVPMKGDERSYQYLATNY